MTVPTKDKIENTTTENAIYEAKIKNISKAIGKTPLLKIKLTIDGRRSHIFAKLETQNLSGSIKDRMALHVIQESYKAGTLKPGDKIVEATSGNTGIAFSAIGRALGHPVLIFMPSWMSIERKQMIQSFGATIESVTHEQGGFLGSIDLADSYAEKNDHVFLPHQFDNQLNTQAHTLTTASEIDSQMSSIGLNVDAFVAGVGTGGTVMGVGEYFWRQGSNVGIHPLEPSNSPTLSTGYKVGSHRIQGISDEFIPSIVNLDKLDEIIKVDDGDAIIMAQKLAAQLGLGLGISSGANLLGAIKLQEKYGDQSNIVTIFCDCSKKYLSTDFTNEIPVKPDYLSSRIELLDFEVINCL